MITIVRVLAVILIAATGLTPPPYTQIFPMLSGRAPCNLNAQMSLDAPYIVHPGAQYTVTLTITNAGCMTFGYFLTVIRAGDESRHYTIYRGLRAGSSLTSTQVFTAPYQIGGMEIHAGATFEAAPVYPDPPYFWTGASAPAIYMIIQLPIHPTITPTPTA